MPTSAVSYFSNTPLVPKYPGGARRQSVSIPASTAYSKGQLVGESVGANEAQTITLTTGGTLGGTYTLTFGGATTSALAFNATAAQVQAALQALATIGANNVAVTGTTPTTSGGVLTATFQNALGQRDVAAMTADGTNLTGTTPGVAIGTATAGAGLANETQILWANGTVSGGTFTITYAGQTTSALAYNATPAQVQAALEALSNVGVGQITVGGTANGPYILTFGGSLAGTNVAAVTVTSSLTGGGTYAVATTVGGAPGTPGLMRAYDAAGTDGRQIPKGVLEYDCASDASGNITWGPSAGNAEFGATRPYVPCFMSGYFATGDLVGLTDAAIAAAGWKLVSGDVAYGILCIPGAG